MASGDILIDGNDQTTWRSMQVEDFSPTLPFGQVLSLLREASAAGRLAEAVDLFLLAWHPTMSAQAHTLVHARNLDPDTWGDEALSTVMKEVMDRLPGLVNSDMVVQNLMGFLRVGLTRSWDRFLDSTGGLDGRSKMSTVHRRRMRLNTLRTKWTRQHGGQPPELDQTFIDWANTEQAKTHKDPARSSMLFTLDDLGPRQGVLSLDVDDDGIDPATDPDAGDGPLSTVDRKQLAAMVIADAEKTDPLLGRCAQIVFGPQTTDTPGPLPTAGNVAAELSIRHARAVLLLDQVHTIAREILADWFGINGVD